MPAQAEAAAVIRRATPADLPTILAIRDSQLDAPLSDPRAATDTLIRRLIDDGAALVWEAPGEAVAGFAAIDAAAGSIAALLVAPGREGMGIGRTLLAAACDALRTAGCSTAMIALGPGSPAERHYLRAGWSAAGTGDGKGILRLPL